MILPASTPRAQLEAGRLDAAIAATRAQARRDLLLILPQIDAARDYATKTRLTLIANRIRARLDGAR